MAPYTFLSIAQFMVLAGLHNLSSRGQLDKALVATVVMMSFGALIWAITQSLPVMRYWGQLVCFLMALEFVSILAVSLGWTKTSPVTSLVGFIIGWGALGALCWRVPHSDTIISTYAERLMRLALIVAIAPLFALDVVYTAKGLIPAISSTAPILVGWVLLSLGFPLSVILFSRMRVYGTPR